MYFFKEFFNIFFDKNSWVLQPLNSLKNVFIEFVIPVKRQIIIESITGQYQKEVPTCFIKVLHTCLKLTLVFKQKCSKEDYLKHLFRSHNSLDFS